MAIEKDHLPYYQEIFAIPEFLSGPALTFGYHDCNYKPRPFKRYLRNRMSLALRVLAKGALNEVKFRSLKSVPEKFTGSCLQEILGSHGVADVEVLDLFDSRADFDFDMNHIIPGEMEGKYQTVIDIGSTEHVFDTRQCLVNLFSMVSLGGCLMMHVPCKGYYNHGLHTFSPECIEQAIRLNGFDVLYLKFTTPDGVELLNPSLATDTIMWIVARKTSVCEVFVNPQQGRWSAWYN